MRILRPGAFVVCTALAITCFLAPSAEATVKVPTGSGAESGGDLYLLQTKGGSLSGSKLVLRGVQPDVTTFTDRPRRSAGSVGVARLAARWQRIFDSAPNAALEVQGAPKSRDVALIELSSPRYRAATRTLTFTVRRLQHSGDKALAEFDNRADGDAVKEFGPASLFVDSGSEALVPALVRVTVPESSSLKIEFEAPVSYGSGVYLAGITTPPTQGVPPTSTGEISLVGSALAFEASPGAGMTAEVILFVSESNGYVSGQAKLPANAEATISIRGGAPTALTNGKFSIPD
jgi:hypothetical protein